MYKPRNSLSVVDFEFDISASPDEWLDDIKKLDRLEVMGIPAVTALEPITTDTLAGSNTYAEDMSRILLNNFHPNLGDRPPTTLICDDRSIIP